MGRGLAAAAAVVAPSASYAATVRRTYRLPALPRVVHNGREPVKQGPPSEPLEAALTVGRLWDPVKNAALLDRAAADLALPFFAAGAQRGPHGETVPLSHLAPLGQLDADKLAALLAQRPVFVSAATFEPFGLAVLEGASAGCALVLSDIATFRELWDGAAVFADPRDPASFAAAIAAVMADPAERSALASAAASRSARFTRSAAATAMSAIYGELAGLREVAA
jgi:glycosyltransferase involved in cell wall biosynthesis